MKRALSLIICLHFIPFRLFANCVVDVELCRERGTLIYQLAQLKEKLQNSCKKGIGVEIDWPGFKNYLIANRDYSISPCLIPLEQIADFCQKDLNSTKSILAKVDTLHCQLGGKDQRQLKLVGRSLMFSADLSNDFRSERPGPSDSAFVKEELQKLFNLNVQSREEKREASRRNEEKERDENRELEAKNREEKIKKQVTEVQTRAKKKAEVYQTETTRLSKWLQDQMASIQKSSDKPEVKSQKMQEASKTYQDGLQKAIQIYGDGQ